MNTKYDIIYEPSLKSNTKKEEDLVADNITNMNNNPIYKSIIPQYMAKPVWGHPRYQPLPFLRDIGKNIYASSVMKQIKDLVVDTDFDIVLRECIDNTDELDGYRLKYLEFFKKPNPDEEYDDFIRKLLDDIFKYDSGIINKVFNPFGEMLQLRVSDGATFKKNPDKHGYLDRRDDIIFDKPNISGEQRKEDFNNLAFNFDSIYSERAAYYQFVTSVQSQIPIPFGVLIEWLSCSFIFFKSFLLAPTAFTIPSGVLPF